MGYALGGAAAGVAYAVAMKHFGHAHYGIAAEALTGAVAGFMFRIFSGFRAKPQAPH